MFSPMARPTEAGSATASTRPRSGLSRPRTWSKRATGNTSRSSKRANPRSADRSARFRRALRSALRGLARFEERLVLPVALFDQVLGRDKPERGRVDAVAEPASVGRAIGENMPQMGIAAFAPH